MDNKYKKSVLEERTGRQQGILRIDNTTNKQRLSSASYTEFHSDSLAPNLQSEPISPQPSVDRLSVTFAIEDKFFTETMDKIPYSNKSEKEQKEDDYNASASAILLHRASIKRSSSHRKSNKRRCSSPFFTDTADSTHSGNQPSCRRSSVFTTSSADSAITVEEGQEQIVNNIRVHKEVLSHVKYQPWPIKRKLRLVQQAKSYIKRHEGELQERLAQSKNTKDILATFNLLIINHWHCAKRELANLTNILIPWESRIKEIESHFGSVVASYFTFLRWLFWVNFVITVILILFVAVPEKLLERTFKNFGERKHVLETELHKATNLMTLWNFEGILKYSPLFYGYYNSLNVGESKKTSYKLPLAYFITGLAVYIYSFVAILRKMAENSRQSKLSEKEDECTFSWKIFTGWDYMIGNSETAHNRTASIILGFKESLLEEAEKLKDEKRNWKRTCLQIIAHLHVAFLLSTSVYAVVFVVERSTQKEALKSWYRQNEITIVVTLIGFIYPILFDMHRFLEQYHPRKALRMQLARIMALNLLNIYSFIFATFSKINNMKIENIDLKKRIKMMKGIFSSTTDSIATKIPYPSAAFLHHTPSINNSYEICFNISVECTNFSDTSQPKTLALTSLLLLTTSVLNTNSNYSTINETFFNNSNSTDNSFDLFYTFFDNFTENFVTINNLDNNTLADTDNELILTNFNESAELIFVNSNDTTEIPMKQKSKTEIFTNKTVSQNLTNDDERTIEQSLNYFSTETIQNKTIINLQTTTEISTECYKVECMSAIDTNLETSTEINIFTSSFGISTETNHDDPVVDLSIYTGKLNITLRKKLRDLCWETMLGQELVKLTIMDLVMTVSSILLMDFIRAVLTRYLNNCWCWDLEKKFPKYGDFKIAENILHLVNNQGMVWMGMFFSPGLPLINLFKLIIVMYLRSWAVLTCNVPHDVVFRASRSNNFYFALLLTMLFLCVLPVGYAIVWVDPSWHCGPFSNYNKIYYIFTGSIKKALNFENFHLLLDYIASPAMIIPLLMLLILIIYYLISLTGALREANNDLKIQLRHERTIERRKMFQLVDKQKIDINEIAFSKWRKILPVIPVVQATSPCGNKELSKDDKSSACKNDSSNLQEKNKDIEKQVIKKLCSTLLTAKDNESFKNLLKSSNKSTEISNKTRNRENSIVSGRSVDVIPEIRISESDSSEKIHINVLNDNNLTKSDSISTIIQVEPVIDQQNCIESEILSNNKTGESSTQHDDIETDIISTDDSYDSIKESVKDIANIPNK